MEDVIRSMQDRRRISTRESEDLDIFGDPDAFAAILAFPGPPQHRPRLDDAHDGTLETMVGEFEHQLASFRTAAHAVVAEVTRRFDVSDSKLNELLVTSIRQAAAHANEAAVMLSWFRAAKLARHASSTSTLVTSVHSDSTSAESHRDAFAANLSETYGRLKTKSLREGAVADVTENTAAAPQPIPSTLRLGGEMVSASVPGRRASQISRRDGQMGPPRVPVARSTRARSSSLVVHPDDASHSFQPSSPSSERSASDALPRRPAKSGGLLMARTARIVSPAQLQTRIPARLDTAPISFEPREPRPGAEPNPASVPRKASLRSLLHVFT